MTQNLNRRMRRMASPGLKLPGRIQITKVIAVFVQTLTTAQSAAKVAEFEQVFELLQRK